MISIASLQQHIIRHKISIFLFLCVGTISAIVNIGSFGILYNYFHLHYQISVTIAYFLSVLVHFTANRRFTFKNHTTHFIPQLQRYITMLITNYLITLSVVQIMVEILHFSPYIGIMSAIACTISISYFMSRFWIFHSSKQC